MKQKFRLKIQFFLYVLFPCVTFSQEQVTGSVAANANVIVHVAEFFPFHEGYAVIKNGYTNYALIDAAGKIVIPYNKYQIYENYDKTGFVNGMCRITDASRKKGYINKQGNLVFPIQFTNANDFFKEGFAYAHFFKDGANVYQPSIIYKDGSRVFIKNRDQSGNANFSWTLDNSPWGNGLCVIYKFGSPDLYGYMNEKGVVNIPLKYLKAQPFSEGLAAVAKKDEYGNIKWGFINTSGQTVIPFQFSNEPTPFFSGLTLIKPLSIPDYDYAYFDKTGKATIKIKGKNYGLPFNDANWRAYNREYDFGNFQDGLAVIDEPEEYDKSKKIELLTKSGETIMISQYINDSGYIISSYSQKINNKQILFAAINKINNKRGMGIVKTDGTILIPPIFNELTPFDPISRLAYAEYEQGKNLIKGYINEEGVFVIVQGKKSGF